MSLTHCTILGVFVAMALAGGAVVIAAETTPATKQSYQERYGVLSERNIFLRERGRPAPSTRQSDYTSRNSMSRPPAEATYVLTGIVLEDGQYRAYIEEVGTGRVQRLGVGDAVAKGHVLEIDIDAIAYSAGGEGTWVPIGCDLQGKPFNSFPTALSRYMSSTSSTNSTSRPSTQGAAPLPIDPNSPNLSVEERMRLRRLQGK
jgi:hypothetical protein